MTEESNSNPHNLFISLINQQKEKEKSKDIWKDSPYKDLIVLQSNNVGNVGEQLIQNSCAILNIPSNVDGTKTKQIGGGNGDGIIKGKIVEIKTAVQGSTSYNFQHELGEVPWNADYMVFIDVSPMCIYITIFKNFDEEQYKSQKKCNSYFPTKTITWRKGKGAFKLDTTVTINEDNIEKGITLKINETTSITEIGAFIDLHIK